jgi:glutamate-1-semialdehyde 2,1-aminomutase
MESVLTPALRGNLQRLRDVEMAAFHDAIPRSRAWLDSAREVMPNGVPVSWMVGLWRHEPVVVVAGQGSTFTDLDGRSYRDFNLCDLAMAAGFAPPAIVKAVTDQTAKGNHFLLPTPDAVEAARLLSERFGLPSWQFTLSASGANVDAMRLARAYTRRQRVVVFEAKYHGHIDELLSAEEHDAGLGIPADSGDRIVAVPFNDVAALEEVLATDDVAAVLMEPVMTNCGLVLPQHEFPAQVRAVTRDHGTLVIADVTHTQFAVFGGGAHGGGLDPDLIAGGKGIGGGVPVGVFGMTGLLADYLAEHVDGDFRDVPAVPTGGTLYGNALSMAAARAGLAEVFTPEAHDRVAELGAHFAVELQHLVDTAGLPFSIDRWGGRLQWRLTPEAPVTGADGYVSVDQDFADARKAFYANRGIWDAIATAGPAVSFAAGDADIDAYLQVSQEFLAELAG